MSTKESKAYKIFSVIFMIAVMVTIFILSAQNSDDSAETSGALITWLDRLFAMGVSQDTIRTAAHFCEYAGLGFSVINFLYAFRNTVSPILTVIIAWGYAFTDEIHQIFVPGRAFQLIDLTVNLFGILLGIGVFALIILIIEIRKEKNGCKKECR